jgi:glutathione S-transferase
MDDTGHYRLIGANGSPYSNKVRAILRYRRLPYAWELRTQENRHEFADLRPQLVPLLIFPEDNSKHLDSTPLAYALEERHPGRRSIIPDDPGHAFLSHLIEDMADEWLTKAMFHYRWAYDADIDYASHWIADDGFPEAKGAKRDDVAATFAERQISRMALVGCTPLNAPIIEASYRHILALLEGHVGYFDYLFGSRPALADFGLFGQLRVLATDPTPLAVMRAEAQRTESWVRQLDDLSGLDGEWLAAEAPLPQATMGLLRHIGEIYLPFLRANNAAIAAGEESFELELFGQTYKQGSFGYQAKCLAELRRRLATLEGPVAERTRAILEETGCLEPLSG